MKKPAYPGQLIELSKKGTKNLKSRGSKHLDMKAGKPLSAAKNAKDAKKVTKIKVKRSLKK